MVKASLYLALVILYLVRIDLWWWDDPTLVVGLPIGLLSQVVFCFLVSAVMAFLVRHAWPHELDEVEAEIGEGGGSA